MTVPVDAEDLVRLVTAPGTHGEPFAHYQQLRRLTPVYRSERLGMTLVTGQPECHQVLTDKQTFQVIDAAWMKEKMPGWTPSASQEQFFSSLFFRNPPEHTRLRAQLSRGFASRQLRQLGPMVEQQAKAAFDRLLRTTSQTVDFQELVSVPLSLAALGGLLGVPAAEQERCWKLLLEAMPQPDPRADEATRQAVQRQADQAALTLSEYLEQLVAAKRAHPGDDLISAYVTEQSDAPDRLTDSELAMALLPILGAGVAALSATLGNAMHTLLSDQDALKRVQSGDFSVERTVAEIFRYCGGYHVTRRYTTRDVELDGSTVPAGSVLVLLLGAANRDPHTFHAPETFDIDRPEAGSLAFGAGIHHCLGAALSKLVAEGLCRELHRVPGLRSAGDTEWRPDMLFFGPERLPVAIDGRRPRAAGA
ncbi:cytochrome P450 [Streptomyces sp. NPDC002513]